MTVEVHDFTKSNETAAISRRKARGWRFGLLGTTAILAALAFSHKEALAATWTNGAADEQWSSTGNWDTGTVPNSSATDATLPDVSGVAPNGSFIVDLAGGSFDIGSLIIEDQYTLTSTGGASTLTIDGYIYFEAPNISDTITIGEDVTLAMNSVTTITATSDAVIAGTLAQTSTSGSSDDVTFNIASGVTVDITGTYSNDGPASVLNLNGDGTLILRNAMTGSEDLSTVYINGLTLRVIEDGTLPTGFISINSGGTLETDGGALTDSSALITLASSNLLLTGDEEISLISSNSTSTVTLDNSAVLTLNLSSMSIASYYGNDATFTGSGGILIVADTLGEGIAFNNTVSLDGGVTIAGGLARVTADASATDFVVRDGAVTGTLTVTSTGETGDIVIGTAADATGGGSAVNSGSVGDVTVYSANSTYTAESGSSTGAATALGGGTIYANGGAFESIDLQGDLFGTGGGVGTLVLAADTAVTGAVNNTGGLIETSAAATLSAGSFTSSGGIDATGGDLVVDAAIITLNTGTVISGDVTFLGIIDTYVDLGIDYTLEGMLHVLGGTTTFSGDADGYAASVLGGTLTSTGILAAVTVDTGGTLNLDGGSAGAVTATNTGVVNVTSASVTSLATTALGGDININNAGSSIGSITSEGGTIDLTVGTVSGTLVVNGGTVTIGADGEVLGTTTADGGTLDSYGSLAGLDIDGGTVTLYSGSETGDIDFDSGSLTIEAGATADGVQAAARASNAGSIASLLVTGGTFTNTGSISGTTRVRNGSTLTTTGTTGAIEADYGTVNINGGSTGAVTVGDDLNTSATVTNAGGTVASVTVDYGSYTNTSGTVTGTTTINGASTADAYVYANGGTLADVTVSSVYSHLTVAGADVGAVTTAGDTKMTSGTIASLEVTGGTTVLTGGEVTGTVDISAGTVTNSATISGTTTLTGGTLNTSGSTADIVNTAGTVNVTGGTTGDISSGSTLNISGGSTGTVTSTGTTEITGGTLAALEVDGGTTSLSAGTISGTTEVDGGTLTVTGGSFEDDVTVTSGTLELGTSLTVDGDVSNYGTLVSTGSSAVALTLTSGNTFTNDGTLDGDSTNGVADLTVTADTIILGSNSVVSGTVILSGDITNNGDQEIGYDLGGDQTTGDGGTTTIISDVDGGGNDVTTNADGGSGGGTLGVDDGVTFDNIGDFVNDGTTNIGEGSTLSAETITNNGTINVGANATLHGTGNTTNNNGATNVADGGTVSDAGAINNNATGTYTFAASGTINADTDNSGETLENAGTIVSTDGGSSVITLGDGDSDVVNNLATGVITVGDSDTFIGTAVTLTNDGDINIGAASTLSVETLTNTLTLDLEDGGTLTTTGTTTNTGTITLAGGGTLNASDIQNSGTITSTDGGSSAVTLGTDTLDNLAGGTLEIGNVDTWTGATTAVTNAGSIDIGNGSTLSVATLDNSNSVSIGNNGTLETSGTITNDSTGTINFISSGTITASDIQNDGVLSSTAGGISTITLDTGTLDNLANGTLDIGNTDTWTGTTTAITNAGSIEIGTSATLSVATLDNSNSVEINSNGTLETSGTITNESTGTINFASYGTISAADIQNDGVLSSTDSGNDAITLDTGTLDNLANGTLDIGNTDTWTGTTTAVTNAGSIEIGTDATLSVASLDNSNSVEIADGGTLETSGVITNDSGATISFLNGGTISASEVQNDGTLSSVDGDLNAITLDTAVLTNTGTIDVGMTDSWTGATTVLTNSGTVELDEFSSLTLAGVTNQSGGSIYLADGATLDVGTAVIDNQAGGLITVTYLATITGNIDTEGTVTNDGEIDGDVAVNGTGGSLDSNLIITGDVNVSDSGSATLEGSVGGDITTADAGEVIIDGDLTGVDNIDHQSSTDFTIEAVTLAMDDNGVITNGGTFVFDGSTLLGNDLTFENEDGATVEATDADLTADFVNAGMMYFYGTSYITGNVTSDASASATTTISLVDGAADDSLTITGDLEVGDVIAVDVDLSTTTGAADTISVSGDVTQSGSTVTFAFNDLTTGTYSELTDGLDILTYGGTSNLSYTVTGLSSTGSVLYQLVNNTTEGAYQLQSGANPAIGGLASGLSLTYSLIGSVVNRPSSAFLTGIAYDTDKECTPGSWARVTGGEADLTGSTTTDLGTYQNDLDANYTGVQAGFDRSCNDVELAGWDLSYGATFGANFGNISQPVYDFDVTSGLIDPSTVTSTNRQSFTQLYGGVYLAAAKDDLFADVQLRYESASFDLSNIAASGYDGLGVAAQDYETSGLTISGSVGRAFLISEEKGLSLVPTIGFSYGRQKVDNIAFDNGTTDTSDDGVLVIDDIQSRIGFASVALTKLDILPSGTEAIRYFGTATVYNDFSERTVAKYYQSTDGAGNPDYSTDPLVSTSDNLGVYGELSLGLNYTKLMNTGTAMAVRQLDASLRADGRFGENMDGWGLTAQVRFSF